MKRNYPDGDTWELTETNETSIHYGKKFKVDFSFISNVNIKPLIKSYMWTNWKDGKIALRSICDELLRFKVFIQYINQHHIQSLKELTNQDIDLFIAFLNTYISKSTKKPISKNYKRKILGIIKSLIRFGQLYFPNKVPKADLFTGNEFRGVNKKLKTNFIPDNVVIQIEQALKEEENPFIKYAMIILKETGMRMSEMRSLKVQYLQKHPVHGWELIWLDSKKQKLRKPTPINVECLKAFRKLEAHTLMLREDADDKIKDYLFLFKGKSGISYNKVIVPSIEAFRRWFKVFIRKNNILDSSGKLYNITPHQFRRTLATDMISKGIDLNAVKDLLGHAHAGTTWKHYADVKDPDRAEVFYTVGIIGDINEINQLIPDQNELNWFMENKDKGARLSDGYCTKPFEGEEICSTFLKRQKCFGCNRFVTTPEYLNELKKYLADLEEQVVKNRFYGNHYIKHFSPTIDILKEIISKLEELKGGKNGIPSIK